jgi:hypothetical protein
LDTQAVEREVHVFGMRRNSYYYFHVFGGHYHGGSIDSATLGEAKKQTPT